MTSAEKSALTYINKLPRFKAIIEQLTVGQALDETQKTYILTCAIVFLKYFEFDKRLTSYAEFSYYIVLKYSISYSDYLPLYDFSSSFGFYPVVKAILDNSLTEQNSMNDCLLGIEVEKYKTEDYVETYHQYRGKRNILADSNNEISYIAPTSFGKSAVIIDCVQKYHNEDIKIGIIVPTKSLLMQTYRMIRNAILNRKILIHDEMYQGESSFIAVFTQERALRLLKKQNIHFDVLFIDEAHNLLKEDSRSILLSRLLAKNRLILPNQKVIYLSPLIEDSKNLKVATDQIITEHRIPFNVKEPEIYEYRLNKQIHKYNRFVNAFYHIGTEDSMFSYIINNALKKNFLYNYRPVKIEKLAKELSQNLPTIELSSDLVNLVRILKTEVHEKFYAVDYITHGIIYLHGKLPDLIKEYLESKFKELPEIKFIIANSVILEGMNLPIDNLYIMNALGLYGKELTNLIGRVNRLNTIFTSDTNNLPKLLPPVHFINSEEYYRKDSNMSKKIGLLRSRTFKDEIDNPTLDEFNFDDLNIPLDQKDRKREQCERIKKQEEFLKANPSNANEKLKQDLLESGISAFYKNLDQIANLLEAKITAIADRSDWRSLSMMEKIADLFIVEINDIVDYEFGRLSSFEARKYYEFHITVSQKRALKQNVVYQFEYFKKRITDNDPVFYFGATYGERERIIGTFIPQPKTYIDLSSKSETELINLAIVKLKMEDDFVSFKLNKLIVFLYDYGLITAEDYNIYVYGTNDQYKIGLTKIGLSVSLISRLDADGQLQYLYFDQSNNLKSLPEFDKYKSAANDLYRFEIERYLN